MPLDPSPPIDEIVGGDTASGALSADTEPDGANATGRRREPMGWRGLLGIVVVLVAALGIRSAAIGQPLSASAQTWVTVFTGIIVQALPFLALGVVLSGFLAAFVTPAALRRILPDRPQFAVPVACVAGAALPGCECGSVPIAGRLMGQGVAPGAALTFLLAAPAINPVVLVATSVAFSGQAKIVLARFCASALTAVVVGWVWTWRGRDEFVAKAIARTPPTGTARREVVRSVAVHDFLHAGGFLVIGAGLTALVDVLVPKETLQALTGSGLVGVLIMAVLAVVLSICSEADAFVAASLARTTPVSALAFMVVGPVVDLKLISMQAGVFSKAFALRFAPLCFVVAVTSSIIVGRILL